MKKQFTLGAALLMTTTAASASGIDRNLTNYGLLFETGNYAELSYANVSPSVSGTYGPTATALGGGATSTDVMSKDFETLSGSVKYDLTDKLALGLFSNQPFGANADYTNGFYTGLAAEWDSRGTSIVLKYKVTPNISVYGGARSIVSQATIDIPDQLIRVQYGLAAQQLGDAAAAAAAGGDLATAGALGQQAQQLGAIATTTPDGGLTYKATTDSDRQTSYIVGAAYERPEIALRVALTYESGYTHSFESVESFGGIDTDPMTTNIEMPDVYTLDFQSGVATDTLVFGSIRHATWSDWEVRPPVYGASIPASPVGSARVTGIDTDTTTYRIGVGRKFSDAISGFARVTYEPGNGDVLSRLSPTDGSIAYGFGGSYTNGAIKVTGGVEYITFGEGDDNENALLATNFSDNDAVAVGLSVGYRF